MKVIYERTNLELWILFPLLYIFIQHIKNPLLHNVKFTSQTTAANYKITLDPLILGYIKSFQRRLNVKALCANNFKYKKLHK
jgi:hypothetical protein